MEKASELYKMHILDNFLSYTQNHTFKKVFYFERTLQHFLASAANERVKILGKRLHHATGTQSLKEFSIKSLIL